MMNLLRPFIAALLLLTSYSACAQNLVGFPDVPSHHKFFDRQNTVAFSAMAGLIAVDAITTQRLVNSGTAREANPLWRPLVKQGWPGEMAASALGYSAAIGVAYSFHKTGHHKMERVANWVGVAMEAGVVSNNLMLDARR